MVRARTVGSTTTSSISGSPMTDSDWVKQERDHEYRMASLKSDDQRRRREVITERLMIAGWAFGIPLVVAVLVAGIYLWQHDSGQRGHEVEVACVESGGTWTTIGGAGSAVCIHIAEAPR